ncbi:MAG TPA: thioredoxin-dependent thiol peroxidase [Lacibacter sp.]|nr:thioredoxin-dependent thiol peroxidase [Lacibacter sp.]HMO88099.1 thioredoxin-dependent thiol peroxidase [Lacibacter sp.]HMP87533.1 thioredoxin-dependent thiol peroxidase [Lacibacter sp.]
MATTKKTVAKKAARGKKAAAPARKAALPAKKSAAKKEPFRNHITRLKAGDKAPAFKGVDQDGKLINATAFKGRKLVLYFYPQDLTPTCTVQACNLRDHFTALQQKGIEVIGVSEDDAAKHKKFETKHQLPFRLLADTDHAAIKAYDVWGAKQFMGKIYDGLLRTTFLINEKGVIDHVITKPDTKNHAQEILNLWGL